MARIGSRDTAPELLVRRLLHQLGYRYRKHDSSLPGCPDLVFSARQKVIFVHGCFWHQHECDAGRLPKSNSDFWSAKLQRNVERDQHAVAKLQEKGWQVLTLWECELKSRNSLKLKLINFLGPRRAV